MEFLSHLYNIGCFFFFSFFPKNVKGFHAFNFTLFKYKFLFERESLIIEYESSWCTSILYNWSVSSRRGIWTLNTTYQVPINLESMPFPFIDGRLEARVRVPPTSIDGVCHTWFLYSSVVCLFHMIYRLVYGSTIYLVICLFRVTTKKKWKKKVLLFKIEHRGSHYFLILNIWHVEESYQKFHFICYFTYNLYLFL